MSELIKIKFTKESYKDTDFNEFRFTELKLKPHTIDELFNIYNESFYEIPKEGQNSHDEIILKSIEYAGNPPNPKDDEIKELREQIKDLQEEIDSIEDEHPYFKNGSVIQARNNDQINYYMQSGKKRKINSSKAFEQIKKRAGQREKSNKDFATPLDISAIRGIRLGPPINNEGDLNIDILTINRYDDRSIDD
tara:strand:- start:342 stop:920 length:579 start_codon:yes stop_codon:yes gene_type:complete